MRFSRRARLAALSGVAAAFGAADARAQSTVPLPEIVVTTPSPIIAGRPTGAPGPTGPWLPAANPAGPFIVVGDTFAPVTVVPRAEIERNQPKTLGEALASKPGVTQSSFAPGGASRPVIRGLDNFRVRIQENGIGAQDVSQLGEDHAVPIDPLAADQIEVIRGPASLRYGSGAIGGVVATTNNRIPTGIPPGGISARTSAGVSSVDRGRETSSAVDAGSGSFAAHADWFKRDADDYRTPAGIQRNSSANSDGASFGGSYLLPNGYVGVGFSHVHSNYHVPGGGDEVSRTRLDVNQDRIFAKGEIRPSADWLDAIRFSFGASNYKHNEIGIGDDGIFGTQATFRNREQEFRIEFQHAPVDTAFGELRGSLGFQLGYRFIGTDGEAGKLLRPTNTDTAATYIFEELRVTDKLKLQAAGRIEYDRSTGIAATFPNGYLPDGSDTSETARKREFAPKSASLGALYQLPYGIVASLTGQYVERAPASPELFSQGSHDAPGTFEIGNANLRKERAQSAEVGLRKADGPWRFDATGYYTHFNNFIYKRLTGIRCGDDFDSCGTADDFSQIVYSQQNATFYGAEISSQYDLLEVGPGHLGVDGQFDFVRAQFSDGTNVPRIPPYRAGGGVYYQDRYWFARVGILHAFAHTAIAENETGTPGYNLMRAEVAYTHPFDRNRLGITDVTVGVVGNNLLDDRIRNSVSFKKDEILLPGRDVRAHVTLRF